MVHTHPSGHVEPSLEDIQTTKRIRKAGEILGIPLVDHLILGNDTDYFSFTEHGDLQL